ncbi:MAG TPA: hypothetical protein VHF69_01550 [Candidatus Synoicihabitans sp.]|nr:hypothetical protein [Candidatus Synoicihabitans sp.]
MNALYGGAIFDEWAVVMLGGGQGGLAAYEGPRLEQFRQRFVVDAHELRQLIAERPLTVGDFVFAPAASGTAFDAAVRVGEHAYLVLNHTARTMEDIRRDPRWLQAQKRFVEMTEAIRADPLVSP